MSMGLAQHLREGTWALHSAAERAGVMPDLLRGRLPASSFQRLQRNLLAIYQALECGLGAHAAHPQLASLQLGPLARSGALQADLAALHGPQWASALPLTSAALAYVQRLQGLARQQPLLLAAHAYVRYLGDLAGGQALRRVAQQAYQLADDDGTRFFDFGPPEQVRARSQALRLALDALPLDDAATQALVAEAQWAFGQHVRLFEELASA
jgi:heme oxygenase